MSLKVRRLSDLSFLPKRGTLFSAGLDLFSPVDSVIQPNQRVLIKLDISIELNNGTFGHILPRSGLALKNGIHIGAGVIDSDYRGNVGVLLFNLSSEPFYIKRGDRIAQLVIKRYEIVEPEEIFENSDTNRGSGGFGSTGI
jgi:dUTP pyrophosphatase